MNLLNSSLCLSMYSTLYFPLLKNCILVTNKKRGTLYNSVDPISEPNKQGLMKMTQLTSTANWADTVFGHAQLGDKRLTRRLVNLANQMGTHIGKSLVASCEGDEAKLEGTYRFIRNARVDAQAIAESGFQATVSDLQSSETILALEDTTTLGYRHQVSKELGDLGSHKGHQKRGFWVHNVLAVDAETERTLGLLSQSYWTREPNARGIAAARKSRAYEEKESFKWEQASREVASRMGEKMASVISVCDREADIYEYLCYKQETGQRFVVRASWNRHLEDEQKRLFEAAAQADVMGHYTVEIPQTGGRKARTAQLTLRGCRVVIKPPIRLSSNEPSLSVNLVVAEELDTTEQEPLRWILFTREGIDNFEQARRITRYYELRWRVEDFHKAWKSSGTGVEELRLQSKSNLQRVAVIQAFVAIRLMQMREVFHATLVHKGADIPCTQLLDTYEWQALWMADKKQPLPKEIPPASWAYHAIARLGGWINTKRTGKVGWATLWEGWYRLQDRIDGMMMAFSLNETVS